MNAPAKRNGIAGAASAIPKASAKRERARERTRSAGARVAQEGDGEEKRSDDLHVRAPRAFEQQGREGGECEQQRRATAQKQQDRNVAADEQQAPEREPVSDREQQLRVRRIDRRNLRMIDARVERRPRVWIVPRGQLRAVPEIAIDVGGQLRLEDQEHRAQRDRQHDRRPQRYDHPAHPEPGRGGEGIDGNESDKAGAARRQRRGDRGSAE